MRQTARIVFDDSQPKVIINSFGVSPLAPAVERLLRERMASYEPLENAVLIINQLEQETKRFDQQRYLIELRKRDSLELLRQQAEIQALQTRIGELNHQSISQISFDEILTEMRVISPFAREVRYAQTYISNFEYNRYGRSLSCAVGFFSGLPRNDFRRKTFAKLVGNSIS